MDWCSGRCDNENIFKALKHHLGMERVPPDELMANSGLSSGIDSL